MSKRMILTGLSLGFLVFSLTAQAGFKSVLKALYDSKGEISIGSLTMRASLCPVVLGSVAAVGCYYFSPSHYACSGCYGYECASKNNLKKYVLDDVAGPGFLSLGAALSALTLEIEWGSQGNGPVRIINVNDEKEDSV